MTVRLSSVLAAMALAVCVHAARPARADDPTRLGEDGVGHDCSRPKVLRFLRGRDAVTVRGTATRDQAGCYAFSARAGQLLLIAMAGDSTDNAAVVVFEPGWHQKTIETLEYTDGKTIPGAGRSDSARHVRAVLPMDGRYLIMAAPAFGGAAGYTVRIEIQ